MRRVGDERAEEGGPGSFDAAQEQPDVARPVCINCKNPDAKVFRRKVCRTCYRKLTAGSALLPPDGRRGTIVPEKTRHEPETAIVPTVMHGRRGPRAPNDAATKTEAMRLLAEGWQVRAVAKTLMVSEDTIYTWRDEPESQRQLAEARKAREAYFRDAIADVRRLGQEALVRTYQVTIDLAIDNPDPMVRLRAIALLWDHGLLPKTLRIEQLVAKIDLTGFSDDELRAYRRLRQKLAGTSQGGGSAA